jgi:hypothetical protein
LQSRAETWNKRVSEFSIMAKNGVFLFKLLLVFAKLR